MQPTIVFHQIARWLGNRLSALDAADAEAERFREGRGTVLTVRCAFCRQVMVAGNSRTVARGICPECKNKLRNEGILDP